jgi:hypothetical protein
VNDLKLASRRLLKHPLTNGVILLSVALTRGAVPGRFTHLPRRQSASGLRQFKSGNREKSASLEQSEPPYSIARAAR